MVNQNLHERLYRGPELCQRLAQFPITICGAGALGANLAESLVRCGARNLSVIDRDRVEEHNLSTQPYAKADIGLPKVKALANWLYRAVAVQIQAQYLELDSHNASRTLRGGHLVVDCFDNSPSRQILFEAGRNKACLHLGMADGYGEAVWNEVYRVPLDRGIDGCDYPLARSLVQLTSLLGCEAIFHYLKTGEKLNRSVTVGDLSIRPYES